MVGSAASQDSSSVATARQAHALEVGRAFADIIRDDPVVRELWITIDTEEPGVHLWLITDPIGMDKIRDLYGLPVDRMYERFPAGDFFVQILNPSHTIGDVHRALRRDAEQIPLRTD